MSLARIVVQDNSGAQHDPVPDLLNARLLKARGVQVDRQIRNLADRYVVEGSRQFSANKNSIRKWRRVPFRDLKDIEVDALVSLLAPIARRSDRCVHQRGHMLDRPE